jgi:hypothetical protein
MVSNSSIVFSLFEFFMYIGVFPSALADDSRYQVISSIHVLHKTITNLWMSTAPFYYLIEEKTKKTSKSKVH